MRTYGILGYPLGHSLSPRIHERLFALSDVKAEYKIFEIPAEELNANFEMLKSTNGFNITIPHKKDIIPYLDYISEKAKLCGSVNTVLVKDNKLYGTSTDGIGMRLSLENHGLSFEGSVLILGNGGAARAVAFEAIDYCKKITIAARDENKSKSLCLELAALGRKAEVKFSFLNNIPCEKYDLLVNTTPVGMYPKPDFTPVDESVLKNVKVLFDAVYNPHDTLLIKKAESLGVYCIYGMEMLVNQAAAAHEFWLQEEFKPYSKDDIKLLTKDTVKEMNEHFYGKK